MPDRRFEVKGPSGRPRDGGTPPFGELARDRGGVEVAAKRERTDVLGCRKGSEPRDVEEIDEVEPCCTVLEKSTAAPVAEAVTVAGGACICPSSGIIYIDEEIGDGR